MNFIQKLSSKVFPAYIAREGELVITVNFKALTIVAIVDAAIWLGIGLLIK